MVSVVAGISNMFFCLKKTKKVFKTEKKNSKFLEELRSYVLFAYIFISGQLVDWLLRLC